jgi:acetoin utilization deacetylase AcuC-like enzyme
MKIFYSETHYLHTPPFEVFDGGVRTPYLETPQRLERILSALELQPWAEILPPGEFNLDPILAVHHAEYVEFLRNAYDEWQQEATDYEKEALLPATFPPRGGSHRPRSLLGKAGYHMMDLSAPILAGTYQAALASAACALSGAQVLTSGEGAAFALCRPPGHHAGRETCGGYCYFNNAAIAAQWLSARGKLAILDIDYHAGNGTQEIFYDRADVLTVSIHADPDFAYPYFSGYADETGTGPGAGRHYNFPLPDGTGDEDYLAVLEKALKAIHVFRPDFLVVSAGMDLSEGDPLGTFEVTGNGIRKIGAKIRGIDKPTLIVLEGGYNNSSLGSNVVSLVENFA